MGKRARSAISGRFIKKSTARRHPRTSVLESTRSSGRTKRTIARSAITGRFISMATAKRNPNTTVVEND